MSTYICVHICLCICVYCIYCTLIISYVMLTLHHIHVNVWSAMLVLQNVDLCGQEYMIDLYMLSYMPIYCMLCTYMLSFLMPTYTVRSYNKKTLKHRACNSILDGHWMEYFIVMYCTYSYKQRPYVAFFNVNIKRLLSLLRKNNKKWSLTSKRNLQFIVTLTTTVS